MLSKLNPEKDDISFVTFGAPQTGKTSFANALLGFNGDKSNEYNSALDLFEIT